MSRLGQISGKGDRTTGSGLNVPGQTRMPVGLRTRPHGTDNVTYRTFRKRSA